LLIIGAHPDDEDTGLLTLVARGMGGESAYFSLSRGEGGQNLIGTELGQDLGLLRSQELLAARNLDGARQYFSRGFDFGYTRSLEETLGFWDNDALLEDAVRVVRRFRPQILVSVFPPNSGTGHGQHQAAGMIAQAVLEAAADAQSYPELLEHGLGPWQPLAFYRASFFRPADSNLVLPSGGIDTASGKSFFQIAMASRSMHRSQGMGVQQPIGPRDTRMEWISGPRGDGDPFDPFETRLRGVVSSIAEGEAKDLLTESLAAVEALITTARSGLNPATLSESLGPLLAVQRSLHGVLSEARGAGLSRADREVVEQFLGEKISLADRAIAIAAGWVLDATAGRLEIVAGQTFELQAQFYNSGLESVRVKPALLSSELSIPSPGMAVEKTVEAGALASWSFELQVPADAAASVPYFLRRPHNGEMYDWQGVDQNLRGEPFEEPPLSLLFDVTVGDATVELTREVVHSRRDRAIGEVRTPLRVVPALEVTVEPQLIVWPSDGGDVRDIQVGLERHSDAPLQGLLEFRVPASWPAVEPIPFSLPEDTASLSLSFQLRRPNGAAGSSEVGVRAVVGETIYDKAYPRVSYPHIRPVPSPRNAILEVRSIDLKLPDLRRLAYLRGASDRVPESLAEIGLPLELLSSADLLALGVDGLRSFDAIVIGSRAYETDPGLRELNPRLLEWVEDGGLLLVQYQQYQFSRGGYAVHPLEIARPHGRITDQAAAVELLEPNHPVFTSPHLIGPEDWEGWVQERGLYFPRTWDDAYRPLLRMSDPDMSPEEGALLIASHGKGTYVYTGLAFFRQLPAGVPGAYRLFLNLLNLAGSPPG